MIIFSLWNAHRTTWGKLLSWKWHFSHLKLIQQKFCFRVYQAWILGHNQIHFHLVAWLLFQELSLQSIKDHLSNLCQCNIWWLRNMLFCLQNHVAFWKVPRFQFSFRTIWCNHLVIHQEHWSIMMCLQQSMEYQLI